MKRAAAAFPLDGKRRVAALLEGQLVWAALRSARSAHDVTREHHLLVFSGEAEMDAARREVHEMDVIWQNGALLAALVVWVTLLVYIASYDLRKWR